MRSDFIFYLIYIKSELKCLTKKEGYDIIKYIIDIHEMKYEQILVN